MPRAAGQVGMSLLSPAEETMPASDRRQPGQHLPVSFFSLLLFQNLGVTDPSSVLYRRCATRSRQCEYTEMKCRSRGTKRLRSSLEESDDYEDEEDTPSRSKTKWNT